TLRGRRDAKLTVGVHLNRCACNWCSTNASDKGAGVGWHCVVGVWIGHSHLLADADGIGLISDTQITDIDIVIAGGKIVTGAKAQGDVVLASGIVKERGNTVGRVPFGGCVVSE